MKTGKKAEKMLLNQILTQGVFIIQGFVASTKDNIVTTMGMEKFQFNCNPLC